jgi:hypothetical protein
MLMGKRTFSKISNVFSFAPFTCSFDRFSVTRQTKRIINNNPLPSSLWGVRKASQLNDSFSLPQNKNPDFSDTYRYIFWLMTDSGLTPMTRTNDDDTPLPFDFSPFLGLIL